MAYDEIYDHFGKALVVLFSQMVQLAHHQMHRYQLGATPGLDGRVPCWYICVLNVLGSTLTVEGQGNVMHKVLTGLTLHFTLELVPAVIAFTHTVRHYCSFTVP